MRKKQLSSSGDQISYNLFLFFVILNSQMLESVRQLKQLSQTIIIVLHLELRSHCFYHLLPTLKQVLIVATPLIINALL